MLYSSKKDSRKFRDASEEIFRTILSVITVLMVQ